MEKQKMKISAHELLLEYLFKRLGNGIADGLSEEDFLAFTSEMLKVINSKQYEHYEFYMEEIGYEQLCLELLKESKAYWVNQNLEFKDGKLYANYNLKVYKRSGMNDLAHQISSFLYGYSGREFSDKNSEVSNYNLELVPKETLMISKKIAAYIVNDLMNRYVKSKIASGNWPSQCSNIDEYIFEKDLASTIKLEGTREAFIGLYNHSIRVVAEMLRDNPNLQLSNNKKNCLAWANFEKLIRPFPFIHSHIYSEYELRNKEILIKVEDEKAHLSECECIDSDPYGDFSDDIKRTTGMLKNASNDVWEKRIEKVAS